MFVNNLITQKFIKTIINPNAMFYETQHVKYWFMGIFFSNSINFLLKSESKNKSIAEIISGNKLDKKHN